MKNIDIFYKKHLNNLCIYCEKEKAETRDHVPSKIILNTPYPNELFVVPSCKKCNSELANDEAYFRCLIECVKSGSTDLKKIKSTKVIRILEKQRKLKKRIEKSKYIEKGDTFFKVEHDRIKNVVDKHAFAHASHVSDKIILEKPAESSIKPLCQLSKKETERFFSSVSSNKTINYWPEVEEDSKALEHAVVGFKEYQAGTYLFRVYSCLPCINVKILFLDYLACDYLWDLPPTASQT